MPRPGGGRNQEARDPRFGEEVGDGDGLHTLEEGFRRGVDDLCLLEEGQEAVFRQIDVLFVRFFLRL